MRKLSVIVPAYNEGPTIHFILEKLRKVELIQGVEMEIIVVNDCSTDTPRPGLSADVGRSGGRGVGAARMGVEHAVHVRPSSAEHAMVIDVEHKVNAI